MRKELCALIQRLAALTGEKPFVLPPPYARGHFRLFGRALAQSEDFRFEVQGGHTFVWMTDGCLLRALMEMDEATPRLAVEPSRSPLDTVLYQIERHGFLPGEMDCPMLARLALDLDGDRGRSVRILARMEPALLAQYAEALRTARQYSMLPAVARQVVFYRQNKN